jgi:hypothetical protein
MLNFSIKFAVLLPIRHTLYLVILVLLYELCIILIKCAV